MLFECVTVDRTGRGKLLLQEEFHICLFPGMRMGWGVGGGVGTYDHMCSRVEDCVMLSRKVKCSVRAQRIPYGSRKGGKLEWNICDFK